ncbi:MAG: DsbA family oxidoreductase [Solirubrobacterales bacterium]
MHVEIWSDIACPWCYVGKRRFEAAFAGFEHRDEVQVTWRSFELDPAAAREQPGVYVERLAAKYGRTREQAQEMIDGMTETAAGVGLDFRFDIIRSGSTFDAHRLVHLGAAHHISEAVTERLFAAYLTEGRPIGEPETLAEVAAETGLDAAEVREVLDGDRFADAVRADEGLAAQLGIAAVPCFVVDRATGASGAQDPKVLLDLLRDGWQAREPANAPARS